MSSTPDDPSDRHDPRHDHPGEIALAVRLAADTLVHLTGTVEDMHRAIARGGVARLLPPPVRTIGQSWSGLVYGAVRTGISLVADAAATALGSSGRTRAARPWTGAPRGRRLVGMVEGAFGDRLALAYPALTGRMRIREGDVDVATDAASLARHFPDAATSVVVFLHGVIETEQWWRAQDRPGGDFATRLGADLGCTSVLLRYNSGRHVSDNGAELDALLTELVANWPVPVSRLALVGHSMGGLVARSAVHQGAERGRDWPGRTRHVVCLGSPHTGAPLERAANAATWLLRRYDGSAPIAALLAARSVGIKDLRHGSLHQLDWLDVDPDALRRTGEPRPYVPPPGVEHANLAVTRSRDPESLLGRRLGDLLVLPASALAATPPARAHAIGGLGHGDLLTHDSVYRQLLAWLRD